MGEISDSESESERDTEIEIDVSACQSSLPLTATTSVLESENGEAIKRKSVAVCAAQEGASVTSGDVHIDEEDCVANTDSGRRTDSTAVENSRGSSNRGRGSGCRTKKRQRGCTAAQPVLPVSGLQVWSIPYTPIILPNAQEEKEEMADLIVEEKRDRVVGVIETDTLVDSVVGADTALCVEPVVKGEEEGGGGKQGVIEDVSRLS